MCVFSAVDLYAKAHEHLNVTMMRIIVLLGTLSCALVSVVEGQRVDSGSILDNK